jgi:hypothetical protein
MERIQKQLKLITDRHDKYRSTMRPRLDKERDRLQIRRQKIDDYIKRTEIRKQEIKNMIVIRTDAYNSAVAKYKLKEKKFAEKIKEFEDKISKLKKESPARGLLEKALFFALKIEYAFMNYPKTSKKLSKTLNEYKNDYRDAVISLRDLLKIDTDSYESRLAEKYSNQIPEDIVKAFIHPDLSESEQIKAIHKDYTEFIEDVQANVDEFQK